MAANGPGGIGGGVSALTAPEAAAACARDCRSGPIRPMLVATAEVLRKLRREMGVFMG